jgi:tRNA U34 2-thiouridine synthase MnmA/TrmU
MKRARALGLFSGGLDSMLAALVLRAQGIEVTGMIWVTPFFTSERAEESAAAINLPVKVEDFTDRYLHLLYEPPRGFGKWMNPCIDCHLLMLREAGRIMEADGYDFLFTGEVVGQRPFSQNKGALNLIARESGYGDLLLRPLSACLLKTTRPEREGLVDRDRLLNISGRGRKRQMELAAQFGITSYPVPAGGCLLTTPGYAARVRDLVQHRPQSEITRWDLDLLKWGRHFRLTPNMKVVVGRDQRNNEAMERLIRPGDVILKAELFTGPLVVIPQAPADADLTMAAALCASYSNAPPGEMVAVIVEGRPDAKIIMSRRDSREIFQEFLL